MKRLIVKVQLPLVTTDPDPYALVYDRSRELQAMVPVTPELLAGMGGEVKCFFYAEVSDDGLTLDRQAPFQDW
jgi:hypothetical protein